MGGKVLCGFLLLLIPAVAQIGQFQGKRIVDIQLSPEHALDPADLAKVLPFRKGNTLDANDVATAIDRLFATGRFADIVVEANPAEGGVIIRFRTEVTYFLSRVETEGNVPSPPSHTQIVSATQLTLGAAIEEEDVAKARAATLDLLKQNGLYESQATTELTRDDSAQQAFLTIHIAGKKRAKYEEPVIQGKTILSNATILRATGWRIPVIHWWRQVTALRTRTGVQGVLAKYQKQSRLEARVELKSLDYDAEKNRARPTLDIDPGPRVKVTAVETKVSNGVLKRYVPVFTEHAVDNDLLAQGKTNLIDYFQDKGYYDVDVDFRVLPEQNDLQTIQYVISRGQRYKLVKVTMTGNRYFDQDTIRERMYMQPASFTLRRGRYSEGFQRKDEETIRDLYRANGFRDAKVTCVVDRNYGGKPGQVAVAVTIEEGPQWFVDRLTVQGIEQIDRNDVASRLASVDGQPFAEVNLASDRDLILTYYYEHGFPKASFKSAWAPNGKPHRVNVTYTITEGDREYVRGILLSGIERTRPRLVNKVIRLKAEDPLSPVEETDIQKNLYDLGVFASVDTAIQDADGAADHKYVLYNFEEAKRYTAGFGIGLQAGRFGMPSSTSVNSPGGSYGISPLVSLDLSRLNFLGIGQTVGLHFIYSTLEKRDSLTYEIPRFLHGKDRTATFTVLYDDSFNISTFASKREEASVQISQRFSKTVTAQFRFAYRRVSVTDVLIPVLLVPQLEQAVRIGILGGTFVHDRRDNPADPHHGMYNTVDLGLASTAFGSERSFARILARNATYHPLTKSIVLARQTQFGLIQPFAVSGGIPADQSIPLPERFFGGGADTLRAFPYNEAGPRDTGAPLVPGGPASQPTGFPLGGNALFYNNIEIRFPLLGSNIGGVIFHDMGNVFSSLGNMSLRFHQSNAQDFDYTVQDVGFGIRYKTPVGPLRVDLAYGLNPPKYIGFGGTPQELLSCNPNQVETSGPCASLPQRISHVQFFFSIGQTF